MKNNYMCSMYKMPYYSSRPADADDERPPPKNDKPLPAREKGPNAASFKKPPKDDEQNGGRRSKKRPTARRRRSSKRNARKARATRRR